MSKSTLRIAVIALTLITAVIHLFLAVTSFGDPTMQTLSVLWLLNSIGYVVLLGGVLGITPILGENKNLAHYALMGFAAITIVAYFLMSGVLSGEPIGVLGPVDKVDEVLLIVATYLHLNKS